MSDVFETVRGLLVDITGIEEDEVTPEASLIEDLGADSLDLVRFIEELEKAFTEGNAVLEIADDDAEDIETVQHVVDMLKRKGIGG